MNICTFGSSDKKAAAAATSRTRRSLLRVGFLVLFVLVFRFFNGSSGYQPYRLLIVFRFLLQHNNIFH